MFGGGVGGLRKQKADADFANGAAGLLKRNIDAHAERFEDVRGAALGTGGTVAVLGDAGACCGSHNGRSGRDVESVGAIAARATGVHHVFRQRGPRGEDRCRSFPHGGGKSGQFFRADGAPVQSQQ